MGDIDALFFNLIYFFARNLPVLGHMDPCRRRIAGRSGAEERGLTTDGSALLKTSVVPDL